MLICCGAHGHVPVVLSVPPAGAFIGILNLRIQETYMGMWGENYFVLSIPFSEFS